MRVTVTRDFYTKKKILISGLHWNKKKLNVIIVVIFNITKETFRKPLFNDFLNVLFVSKLICLSTNSSLDNHRYI